MSKRHSESGSHGSLKEALLVAVLVIAVGIIAVMASDVIRKLEALKSAESDNVQWTLSRLEVERLNLQAAVEEASRDRTLSLSGVKRRFDLFYSRFNVISTGQAYALFREEPDLRAPIDEISAFLDRGVPLIDGPEVTLRDALPDLAEEVRAIGVSVQEILLNGLAVFSRASDTQREQISRTLLLASIVAIALLAVLSLMVFFLLRSGRISRARATHLEETSTRLSTIITTSLDAIVVASSDGTVLEFNDAAEDIFGFGKQEAVGEKMSKLFIPDHHVAAHDAGMKRYIETGEKHVLGKGRVQLEAKRKSGRVFPVELSISSAITPQGEIFVSYLRDISRRKADEAELVKSRDDALAGERAKAKFIAVMSHEMRTPLNGIIGSLELLKTSELTDTQRLYHDMMEFSAKRLLEHVNDVLDISKIEADEDVTAEQAMNVEDILRGCVDSQSSSAQLVGNSIDLQLLSPIPEMAMGDPRKLRRIILNLLGNANKFTNAGRITLEAEMHGQHRDASMLEIRVADTGIGIAEKDQKRIFDDFVTLDEGFGRAHGGTGLGLGITRRLVQSMGGEIGLESEPGMGSVFWVRLPLRSAPLTDRKAEAHTPVSKVAGGRRVPPLSALLVEDNQINQVLAQRMLEADGHRVVVASDGGEGVLLAAQNRFDVIFMDISMPRIDGITATRRIRNGDGASRDVPIIALTAHSRPEDVESFLAVGMNKYLSKPLTRERLREALVDISSSMTEGRGPLAEPKGGRVVIEDSLVSMLSADEEHEFRRLFHAQIEDLLPKLIAAGLTTNLPDVLSEMHKLKGSAGIFGLSTLVGALSDAEQRLKSGDLAAAEETADILSTYLQDASAVS